MEDECAETETADACFTASWRAVHEKLNRRARYLAKGDHARAEDLLSCTAIKSLQLLRRSAKRIHNPEGFLFLVLQHTHIDSLRREQRENRIFDHAEAEYIEQIAVPQSPLEYLSHKRTVEMLARLVSRLPPVQQQLLTLAFINGASYAEIAACLGISNALVRKRIQLLRDKLRLLLPFP
ncbi:MAG: RNA polymerase sigma factor [Azoarcus sp.]|jgi:RNA polymerase sigma-70 factor (ECF subfamily)|nr:RNA polymerase sigma factor [Azoarcus sp.]